MNAIADATNLAPWQTFYEIIGSAGGALVGLQFLAIALLASTRSKADFEAINAFATPNVLHFSVALTISATMCAPWPSMFHLSVAIALCGIGGVAYSSTVLRRAARQTSYKALAEDWLWYAILPVCIYVALTVAAVMLQRRPAVGHFMIAGVALGLLLLGIRNAWDSVTHIVVIGINSDRKQPK